jgi:3-polyprenyl-4-hydroxybenzoate decarboxylase
LILKSIERAVSSVAFEENVQKSSLSSVKFNTDSMSIVPSVIQEIGP